jgi:hypothetical protein
VTILAASVLATHHSFPDQVPHLVSLRY